MENIELKPGTIIEKEGKLGIVVPDHPNSVCLAGQALIEWEGDPALYAVDVKDFKIIGVLKRARVNQKKCGDCVYKDQNNDCGRWSIKRHLLIHNYKKGERIPKELYPDCKNGNKNKVAPWATFYLIYF